MSFLAHLCHALAGSLCTTGTGRRVRQPRASVSHAALSLREHHTHAAASGLARLGCKWAAGPLYPEPRPSTLRDRRRLHRRRPRLQPPRRSGPRRARRRAHAAPCRSAAGHRRQVASHDQRRSGLVRRLCCPRLRHNRRARAGVSPRALVSRRQPGTGFGQLGRCQCYCKRCRRCWW